MSIDKKICLTSRQLPVGSLGCTKIIEHYNIKLFSNKR